MTSRSPTSRSLEYLRNTPPVIILSLPFPPSVNNLFRNVGKRRATTERYKTWKRAAENAASMQRQKGIGGPVEIEILLGKPATNRKRDISNLIKAPEDLLVRMGLIEDDSLVRRCAVGWADVEDGTITVLVWPAEAHTRAARGDRRAA